jgi:hypothetical protein
MSKEKWTEVLLLAGDTVYYKYLSHMMIICTIDLQRPKDKSLS